MPTPEARRARLGHLYELLAGSETVDEFATGLARAAVDHMDVRVSCGLTAHMEARTVMIASTDALAADLDRIQDTAGEGPCIQAIATGLTVEVSDLADAPWPAWRDVARGYGLRRALSLPLVAHEETLGALNMYSTSAVPFTDEDREAAQLFATHATGTLMVAVRLAQLAELTGHLETALESRGVIDQNSRGPSLSTPKPNAIASAQGNGGAPLMDILRSSPSAAAPRYRRRPGCRLRSCSWRVPRR